MGNRTETVDVIDLFTEEDSLRLRRAGNVLYATDVYVKCWSLDVTLPIASRLTGDIDIFELTVLQFAGLHRMTLAELSDEICLAEDFLKTILARLADKGYLCNDSNGIEITEEGRKYLSQEPEDSTATELVRLLMLPETGHLLPLIVPIQKQETGRMRTGELQGRFLTVHDTKSQGEARERQYPVWVPYSSKDAKSCKNSLTQSRLRQFIRQYNSEHAAERRNLDLKRSMLVSGQHVVYLHAIVLLQRGLIGIPLVADSPYGNDQALAVYARQYQKKALADIRRRADEGRARRGKQENREGSNAKYRRYDDIHTLMKPLEAELLAPAAGTDESSMPEDEQRQYRCQREDNLKQAYRAVESALSYYIQMYPLTDERQHVLRAMNIYENRHYMMALAKDMGFQTGPEAQKLFGQLDQSRIETYFSRRIANLYTVLPLALASTVDHPDSSMWRVVREQPDLLSTLACLTKSSQFRHGSADGTPEDNAAYQAYPSLVAKVKRFLELLLPGYCEDEDSEDSVDSGMQDAREMDASNLLLHAEDVAVSLLGADVYGNLNRNMQDDILAVTAKYNDIDLAPVDFISNLAKILENFYRSEVTAQGTLKRKTRADIVSHLSASLSDAPGCGADRHWQLPTSLRTVRESMIAAASRGENATLGAYALVYFGNLEPQELAGSAADLACVAEILHYRRHDNNLQLALSRNKLKELRNAVFLQIKHEYKD